METPICQSCGMPMAKDELFGTEKDGTRSQDYCTYCYQNGQFNKDETMDEMIATCVPFMVREGMTEEKARAILQHQLPTLKRWRQ